MRGAKGGDGDPDQVEPEDDAARQAKLFDVREPQDDQSPGQQRDEAGHQCVDRRHDRPGRSARTTENIGPLLAPRHRRPTTLHRRHTVLVTEGRLGHERYCPRMSVSSAVLSFALVAGLVTVMPGLDTALVLRAALRSGPRPAFATAVGIGTGALAWGAAAAVGVSALLTASHLAYTGLRIIGAGYMVWLGVGFLREAFTTPPTAPGPLSEASTGSTSNLPLTPTAEPENQWAALGSAWRRGLLTNLLNPKIGAFYVAVLPQFIPEHTSALAMGLLLAFVHDLEGMLWFSVLIVGAHRMRALLERRRAQQMVDGMTGSVLIGFGLRLGLSR